MQLHALSPSMSRQCTPFIKCPHQVLSQCNSYAHVGTASTYKSEQEALLIANSTSFLCIIMVIYVMDPHTYHLTSVILLFYFLRAIHCQKTSNGVFTGWFTDTSHVLVH